MMLKQPLHSCELANAIFDEVQEGILVVDSKGVVLDSNKKFQSIINLSEHDIIGNSIEKIMPNLSENKEIGDYRFEKINKMVFVKRKRLLINNDYVVILFICENHFNMELAQRYAEVKQSKEIFESILDAIDEGIHVADVNGKVKYINPAQEKLDGLEPGQSIGKNWFDIYDLDEDTSLVMRALKTGEPIYDEYQNYVVRNGRFRSVVCSSVPLRSEGRLIGAAAIVKDYIRFKETADKILSMKKSPEAVAGKSKKDAYYCFSDIIGKNERLLESIKWAKSAAASHSPVLIFGETGTGKEMFAQSIHSDSNRSKGPFIAINCAAIPENLLEGILFGTTKGVFTGAIDRAGLFEQANNGTLFLDEMNSMSPSLQSKLLRVLEEKRIMRLGGRQEISIDVRIISSCNIEPAEAIERGKLRSDLFYRLAVIYIAIPPLRERLDDLSILIDALIKRYNLILKKNVKEIDQSVLSRLYDYYWPGNVRQLKHGIECAMNILSCEETIIRSEYIPFYIKKVMNHQQVVDYPTWRENCAEQTLLEEIIQKDKEDIIMALKRSKGNIAKAAQELGISRQKLHYKVKKYKLK